MSKFTPAVMNQSEGNRIADCLKNAASEMYEALKELRDHHSHCGHCDDSNPDPDSCLLCMIDAILAKADGRVKP